VNFYNRVADTLGGANKVNDSSRLFMVPGRTVAAATAPIVSTISAIE
jgi:hypothetical protein